MTREENLPLPTHPTPLSEIDLVNSKVYHERGRVCVIAVKVGHPVATGYG